MSSWAQSKLNKRGRPHRFSNLIITAALMVKRVFSIPKRAVQGFIDSIFRLVYIKLIVRITPGSVVELSKLRSHLRQKREG